MIDMSGTIQRKQFVAGHEVVNFAAGAIPKAMGPLIAA